jgi:hypothetical protein
MDNQLLNFPKELANISAIYLTQQGYTVTARLGFLPDDFDSGLIVFYAPNGSGFQQGDTGNLFEHSIGIILRGISSDSNEQYVLATMLAKYLISDAKRSELTYSLKLDRDMQHIKDGKDRFRSTIYFNFQDEGGK